MIRRIVVGDIHGCFDELQDLLSIIKIGRDDLVISVGDLIVKGEKSLEVLDLFIGDQRFSSVLGNHERAIMRFWSRDSASLKTAQEKTRVELEPHRQRYSRYFSSLPLTIDLGSHLVMHAGLRPGVPLASQSPEDLTEIRTLGSDRSSRAGVPWYEEYNGAKIILFGHWPSDKPRTGPKAIGLDTGCVYGNRLTAYIIEEDTFVSVNARRAYDPRPKPGFI